MLNKFFVIFSILLISKIHVSAQTLSAGPIVGFNISTITGVDNTEFKTGFSAGGFLNYSINEKTGFNAKILYTQLGANVRGSEDFIRFNYIQIPISFVYFFGELGDKYRPKFFIGPYLGFLLKATDQDDNEILFPNSESPFKSTDFGGQVGAGLNTNIGGRTWLNFEIGLASSLLNVPKENDGSYKHSVVFMNVGVAFPLGD